jgi:hypothetical protein
MEEAQAHFSQIMIDKRFQSAVSRSALKVEKPQLRFAN